MKSQRFVQRALICALAFGSGAGVSRADTVFLNDGREINGAVVSDDGKNVVIRTSTGKTLNVRRADIDTIVREKSKAVTKVVEEPKIPIPTNPTVPGTPPVTTKDVPVSPTVQTAPANANGQSNPPAAAGPILPPKQPSTPVTPPAPDTVVLPPSTPPAPPSNATPDDLSGPARPSATNPNIAGAPSGPGIPGFPEFAKRMSKRKEALFLDALEVIKVAYINPESPAYAAAVTDIQGLGSEAIPYLWTGAQHDNSEVRTACMKLIGMMNGRTCIKRVIETFYATMPEASPAATWNVAFVREMIATTASITGQSFITVEARRSGVQDGLKKYIEWYKTNYKSLPRQIGEPELDATDLEYEKKLKAVRELKLAKREWPRPDNLPVDMIAGPSNTVPDKGPTPIAKDLSSREADKKFGESIPTVDREKSLKRPDLDQHTPSGPVSIDGLKRPLDKVIDERQGGPAQARRDPPVLVPPRDPVDKKLSPLMRPQDVQRELEKGQ